LTAVGCGRSFQISDCRILTGSKKANRQLGRFAFEWTR
jgi:hypothetical protein